MNTEIHMYILKTVFALQCKELIDKHINREVRVVSCCQHAENMYPLFKHENNENRQQLAAVRRKTINPIGFVLSHKSIGK